MSAKLYQMRPSTPFLTEESLAAARVQFAQAFSNWLTVINGFSQQDPHKWTASIRDRFDNGEEVDGQVVGVFNSQVNGLINNNLSPREKVCVGLGNFNLSISSQSFPGISDPKLAKRLRAATPFLTCDDRVAGAIDFYAMFIGLQPIREEYLSTPELSPDEVMAAAEALRESFRGIAKNNLFTRKEAWDNFLSTQPDMTSNCVDLALEVVTGWEGSETRVNTAVLKKFAERLKVWENSLQ